GSCRFNTCKPRTDADDRVWTGPVRMFVESYRNPFQNGIPAMRTGGRRTLPASRSPPGMFHRWRANIKRISCARPPWCYSGTLPGSGEVEPIVVHHLVPCGHEVTHELLLRIVTCVDFRQGAELRVRSEDKIDRSAGPFDAAGGAISTFV